MARDGASFGADVAPASGAPRRVLVALNARSGVHAAAAVRVARERIAAHDSLDLDLIVPDEPTAETLARACRAEMARGVDAVVVQGGDGMVRFGVELVAGTRVPLGIVPAGSGNDFARALGLPRKRPLEALEAVLRALEHPAAQMPAVDAIRLVVDGHASWVANSLNIGFDAEVNRRANALTRIPGSARYLIALAQSLGAFRPAPYRIGFDGATPAVASRMLVAVCNGSSIGGGIRVAPGADTADGLLDVISLRPVSRRALMTYFPLALRGRHLRLPFVEAQKVRSIVVDVPPGVPIYADGEHVALGGQVEAEVVPGAWRLLRR